MRVGDWIALVVAVLLHVALFIGLSLYRSSFDDAVVPKPKAIDISLVDKVALESSGPKAVSPPAQSIAPESGRPEDAAPPAPSEDEPDPARAKADVPKPAPSAQPSPAPTAPAARKADRPDRTRRDTDKSAKASQTQTGSDPKSRQRKPTGAKLGDNFLKGIVANDSPGKSNTPRAANVSRAQAADLASAIQRQVQPCANRIPNPGPGANQILSRIRLQMSPDGTMAARPELRGQTGVDDGNQRYARRVAELAIAAFIQCAPYHLPAELYENGWKDIIINYKLP